MQNQKINCPEKSVANGAMFRSWATAWSSALRHIQGHPCRAPGERGKCWNSSIGTRGKFRVGRSTAVSNISYPAGNMTFDITFLLRWPEIWKCRWVFWQLQDEHRQWRRIRTKLNNAWVALDWDSAPLLRPQGVAFSQRPLEPLCQAAREGRWDEILEGIQRDRYLRFS